jgi:hypothetical protein
MGLRRRLEGLEERAAGMEPAPEWAPEDVREKVLDEIADARRNGRPLSPEAPAVCEYFRRRWERESQG